MKTLQKYKKHLYVIILIGIVIYFPIFFNGFVWDDNDFILNNPQIHGINIPDIFGPGLFNSGLFYRPIPALYFAIVYSLSGQHAFLYHILQLSLHLIDSFFLFLFFCLFFTDGVAFFLALIFLVHPINVESVAFISASQSELFFLPGIIALLLASKLSLSRSNLLWIAGLLLFSTLTKETGFLFLFLVFAYRYLFKLDKIKTFVVIGICIGVIYGFLRLYVGGVFLHESVYTPIATLSFSQRLVNIPAIIVYYLYTFFFPITLTILQNWFVVTVNFQNFIAPLLICLLFIVIALYFLFYLSKQTTKQLKFTQKYQKSKSHLQERSESITQFVFFVTWFIIGMSLLLQIVPLDMTVADRWFYFPIVGLLGMIGVVITTFMPKIKKHYRLYFYGTIVIIGLLSMRSYIRTFDWNNDLTIYADAQNANGNYDLDESYAYTLFNAGQYDKAIFYEKKSIAIFPTIENGYFLGDFYKTLNQPYNAISAYNQALTYYKNISLNKVKGLKSREDFELESTYNDLVFEYALTNDPGSAIKLINRALKKFPKDDPNLYLNLAIAYTKIGNHTQALKAISTAYALSPNQDTGILYDRIKNNLPLGLPVVTK